MSSWACHTGRHGAATPATAELTIRRGRLQPAPRESDSVEPPLSTVRRVLHACGFDLSLSLIAYEPDEEREARLRELPASDSAGAPARDARPGAGRFRMTDAGFDPYALLRELERHDVAYVLTGGLARVLHGSGEVTRGVDITPAVRPSNLQRLHAALQDLDARGPRRRLPEPDELVSRPTLRLATGHGELQIISEPAGTSGYADLRRRATRQPIGRGIRPPVAARGDLARMLEALGRPGDLPTLHALHRIIELDRGRVVER